MFSEDGKWVLLDSQGKGAVTLPYACMDCHPDKHINWLAKYAKDFHLQPLLAPETRSLARGGMPSETRGTRKREN